MYTVYSRVFQYNCCKMFKIKRSKLVNQQNRRKKPYNHIEVPAVPPANAMILSPTRFILNEEPQQSSMKMPPISKYTGNVQNIDNSLVLNNLLTPNLPMLAHPMDPKRLTDLSEYVYEEKFDGERMIAMVFDNRTKKCFTRTLKVSNIFKNGIILADGYSNCIFDGEVVYMNDEGKIVAICDTGIRSALRMQYKIFDVQMVNGENVMHKPLIERKHLLEKCIVPSEFVTISKMYKCTTLEKLMQEFNKVCDDNGEGLMLKHSRECYSPNRRVWIKLKKMHLKENREEFELFAHQFKRDKNGIFNILDCGYYDSSDNYKHVTNVSSGINAEKRNYMRLLIDENTGMFRAKTIVTIIADKITANKSLRHPSLLKIRNDLDGIDTTKFI